MMLITISWYPMGKLIFLFLSIFLSSHFLPLFKFRYLSDEELRADEEDKEDMVNILYDKWYDRKLKLNTC